MTDAGTTNLAGFPAAGTIFAVAGLDLAVLPEPHPWFDKNRAMVAEDWARESAANPHLFDGEMVFQHQVRLAGGHIEGRAHLVPFSAFLCWRKGDRATGGCHLFGMPLLLSSDNALIAIRMAETTANPGRVYCAAGSMDRHDIVDGRCDLLGNMRREVLEETGIDLDDTEAEAGLSAVHSRNTVTLFRRHRLAEPAEAIIDRIADFVARQAEPEITGAVAIRSADPGAHDYPFFMPPILNLLFPR